MKKAIVFLAVFFAAAMLTGCGTGKALAKSAEAKNLDLSGFLSYSKVEAANTETATPQGTLIVGRVTYRSRKVGIPADQKVPNTGTFRAVKTKNIFGTEEEIIEYDWTAESDADAKAAEKKLKEMKRKAENPAGK